MASKAVATAAKNEVALDDDFKKQLAGYKGAPTGFEQDTKDDYVIPFFTILQGLSPQMETVEGAKLGAVINTSTNELFPDGINLVAVRKVIKYVEWAPNRGGLVAVHDPESDVVKALLAGVEGDKYEKLVTKEGNQVQETKYVYGVLCDDDMNPMGYGCIGFAVTKIKKYNAWNTDARNKQAQFDLPLHSLVWHFGVQKERNTKGEFYNWTHSLLGGSVQTAFVKLDSRLAGAVAELMGKADEVKLNHAGERDGEEREGAM